MRRLLAIVLALSGCEHWTNRDTAFQSAFTATAIVDWAQTTKIVGVCNEYNPVIGPCGNRVPVNLYFPVVIVLHAAIAAVLPEGWLRTSWQAGMTGLELGTVFSNAESYQRPPDEHPVIPGTPPGH